jgi:hypothetical protein
MNLSYIYFALISTERRHSIANHLPYLGLANPSQGKRRRTFDKEWEERGAACG